MDADFRRFRIGGYSNDFAARDDAARARGSPAVPHWGFFRFLCRARRRDAGARVSGGSALGFLPVPLPREVARRRRAGLRRFRVSGFEELCRAKRRERAGLRRFRIGVSSGSFAARSDANARGSGGFALAILPALLAHEARRFHVRKVIPALSRTRRCGRGRG